MKHSLINRTLKNITIHSLGYDVRVKTGFFIYAEFGLVSVPSRFPSLAKSENPDRRFPYKFPFHVTDSPREGWGSMNSSLAVCDE